MHASTDAGHALLILGCLARYKSNKVEEKEDIPLLGPQLLALMELCYIRACFASRVHMKKVCDCHLVVKKVLNH